MQSVIDSLQVSPPERKLALANCFEHIKRWRIALPSAEPLVMDFGLGDFEKIGLIEFWIANEAQAGYCGKYMFVGDGQTCPRHAHRVKHETFFIVRGEMEITLDDQRFRLQEGQSLAIEPGRVHSFSGVGPALMLELSMPCDPGDNFFEEPRTMVWLQASLQSSSV
jgi:D-lyxose ketol-isomerase